MRSRAFRALSRLPGRCEASIAVLDALGVAGEEEEMAQTQSTSVGRVAAMAGGMLIVVAARCVVVLEVSSGVRQDVAQLVRKRRPGQDLIDAGVRAWSMVSESTCDT